MNSKTFIEFLKKLYKDAGKPILVITDNARYHRSKQTKEFIKKQKGNNLLTFFPGNLLSSIPMSRCGIIERHV